MSQSPKLNRIESNQKLFQLLGHEDVRVRVSAAALLWKRFGDERVVEVLTEALKVNDQPMAMAFVYPSRPGTSHRVFACHVFRECGSTALAAVPSLTAIIREAAGRGQTEFGVTLGYAALSALAAVGVTGEDAKEIRDLARDSKGPFAYDVQLTERYLLKMKQSAHSAFR